jgi:C4-dicarboxylate-specific signal transduction histidine kinase
MARTPQSESPRKQKVAKPVTVPKDRKSRSQKPLLPAALIAESNQSLWTPTNSEEYERRITLLTESNRQLRRKIFDLYTVFEISRNIAGTLETKTLIDSFLLTCLGQMSASRAVIFLKTDDDQQSLRFMQVKGLPVDSCSRFKLSDSSPLMQHLQQLNRPLELRSEQLPEERTDERAFLELFTPGVIVPLVYKSNLIGIFLIGEKFSRSSFSVDDLEFLSVLGNQIAVALQNAQLYENERRATTLLRDTQEALVQSEKLAALGEMSARVAHEVNNPLGIIKNYLLLIRKGIGEAKQGRQYIDIVDNEIDRIAGIVKQLLEFHRPHPVQLIPTDLSGLVREIGNLMERPLTSGRVTLAIEIPDESCIILGVAEQIRQVLLNLIINARDAIREQSEDGGSIRMSCHKSENNIVLRVKDSGPGIPIELREKVFEPFVTTKAAGQGTGLGLAVCSNIMKAHRGSITYERTETTSVFVMTFPRFSGQLGA